MTLRTRKTQLEAFSELLLLAGPTGRVLTLEIRCLTPGRVVLGQNSMASSQRCFVLLLILVVAFLDLTLIRTPRHHLNDSVLEADISLIVLEHGNTGF